MRFRKLRRRKNKAGKLVGNWLLFADGKEVNLKTKEYPEARRRAALHGQGRWPDPSAEDAADAAAAVEEIQADENDQTPPPAEPPSGGPGAQEAGPLPVEDIAAAAGAAEEAAGAASLPISAEEETAKVRAVVQGLIEQLAGPGSDAAVLLATVQLGLQTRLIDLCMGYLKPPRRVNRENIVAREELITITAAGYRLALPALLEKLQGARWYHLVLAGSLGAAVSAVAASEKTEKPLAVAA